MNPCKRKRIGRQNRARRVRKKIYGLSDRPRLCVRRTLKHIYAQIYDDITAKSILQVGSAGKEMEKKKNDAKVRGKTAVAKLVGEIIAAKAIEKGITKVVFDRKGYPFHGRVKALADAARAKGLQF